MKVKKTYVVFFLLICFTVTFARSVKQIKTELEKTVKNIQQKTLEKQKYITEQRNISLQLKKIETELKKIDVEKKDMENKIYQTQKYISSLEKKIDMLSTGINFYRRLLTIGINKYMEKYVLTTSLIEDNFYRRINKDILRSYADEIKNIETQIETISMLKQEYNEKKKKLTLYYNELLSKLNQQRQLFVKKSELLNEYKSKQKKVESEIKELQKTQKELEELLKKIKEKQKQQQLAIKPYEVQINKKFIKPINGEVVCKFGKEIKSDDGSCVVRNGVVIQGLSNSNVVCVENGRVVFVSNNFRSYGKIIIVEHKDNVHTVYAQLGEIFVNEGTNVVKNQIIAKTDSTGQIYFEIRKNFIPVNPELCFE